MGEPLLEYPLVDSTPSGVVIINIIISIFINTLKTIFIYPLQSLGKHDVSGNLSFSHDVLYLYVFV
jgi:hypothetical protein